MSFSRRVRINLRLLFIKATAAIIGISPDRAFAAGLVAVPYGAVRMFRGISKWSRLARFFRLAKVNMPGWLSVPAFFVREAGNILWSFVLHEVDGAIGRHVSFDGIEQLKKTLETGRGAIIVGAHIGPQISARLLKEQGIETRALASERTIRHIMEAARYSLPPLRTRRLAFTAGGGLLVQSRKSERALVEHVKGGGAVMMPMDFPAASVGGEFVEFLGSPFKFNTFAFKLALRHDVPVFFFFLVRQGRDTFRLDIIPCEVFSTPKEGLIIYKTRLESMILADPFEWEFSQRYCRWLETRIKPAEGGVVREPRS